MPKWKFISNEANKKLGINDPAIKHFDADGFKYIAREICQNSLDAKDKNSDKPVCVEFRKYTVKKSGLDNLGRNDLSKAFIDCSATWIDSKSKENQFAKQSIDIISQDKITVMRISDFNTTGLTGCCDIDKENSNWHNLLKGLGASDKGEDDGGSFGLGKSAVIASSKIRTLFYSTLDIYGNQAYQGYTKLINFNSSEGRFTGEAYFGDSDFNQIINDQLSLDPIFNRENPGTDIYILAPNFNHATNRKNKDENNWKHHILLRILYDFLLAVYDEKLEVKITEENEPPIEINKNKLKNCFELLLDKLPNDNQAKEAYSMYLLLTGDCKTKEIDNFNGMGKVRLRYYFKSGLCNKIFHFRNNGMMVFGRTKNLPQSYIAILELVDTKVNAYFKGLENPAHERWDTSDPVYKELKLQIENILSSSVNVEETDSSDITGAEKILPDYTSGEVDSNNSKKESENKIPDEITEIIIIESKKERKGGHEKGEESLGTIGRLDGYKRTKKGDGKKIEDPDSNEPFIKTGTIQNDTVKYRQITRFKIRTFLLSETGNTLKYRVSLQALKDYKKIFVKFFAFGESGVSLNEIKPISVKKMDSDTEYSMDIENVIIDKISEGERIILDIEFESEIKYAVEVELYAEH